MQLKSDPAALLVQVRDLIDQCLISREARRQNARMFQQLWLTGSLTAAPSKHNRCFSHVDKLSSFLFSPSEVRLTVEFDGDGEAVWQNKAERTSQYLNRKFNRTGCGEAFAEANELALIEGSAFVKLIWTPKGLQPWVIRQSFMGVLREDIPELDRQEAFVHSFYVTKDVFRRMIYRHPDKAELLAKVSMSASVRSTEDITGDSYFHEIVMGGIAPISYTGSAPRAQSFGAVSIAAPQAPMLSPDVAQDLLRVDDLWVWDDDLEDWTTIRYVEPGMIIEGRLKRRNLGDAPGRHPFIKVCSNKTHGYFWGRSELATVLESQMLLNARVDDIDNIFRLQSKPPRAFFGFQGITQEKARAMLSPGSTMTEGAPGGKVENLAPDMPPNALEYLDKLEAFFDDAAGFTNILSGQGEPGVRAGVHAGVLLRTSTPRLRDRALIVERQCGELGSLGLDIMRAKDATVLKTRSGMDGKIEEFTLAQLPSDAEASVDSHTSSPAFAEDTKALTFQMAKAGIIDGITAIEMLHPPREDMLIERLRQRQEAEAAAIAANPALAEEKNKK